MKKEFFLKAGDKIDVVAPGYRSDKESVKRSQGFLRELGYQARFPSFGKHPVSSNSEEIRSKELCEAVSSDSKMIWFLRGGYGCIHTLPELAKLRRPTEKLSMGYSDVTSFLIFAVQAWGWRVVHGPMVDGIAHPEFSKRMRAQALKLVHGEKLEFSYQLKPRNEKCKKLQGEILGGNSVVAASTLGTPFQLSGKGRILFFEDIGERGYKIDRVLTQMGQCGVFQGVRAVVFGAFTESEEPNGRSTVSSVISHFASQVSFPVYSGLPVGHGKHQNPVPMGVRGKIDGDHRLSVRL